MDLRLVALLLFCHCRHGWTDDVLSVTEIPFEPTESLGDSEFLSATTSPPSLTMESEKASSEEEPDGICASSLKSKKATGHGILKLGLELMEKLKTGPEQPNIIISPLSISLALSQLALGAENQTKDLLLHHLHAEVPVCYHKAFRSLLLQLQQSTPQIATRMYTAPGFEPKLEFVQDSQQMYNSKPEVFPGVEEVNEWVKKATNGHVTDLLTNVPPELVLMLINAVHYKGEWQTSFDPRHTASDLFYVDNKHIVNVEMMVEPKYPLRLFIHNELDAQVARLPFKDQMSLLIVLPMAGQVNVSDIAEKFNMSDVYSQLQRERSMQVRLPKFKMEYSQELQEVLTSIGLGELFTAPNLSGISDSPLQVTSVQHKTSMEINEKGAEAAAATSVSVSRSNPIFSVNQPFFFALMDDETLAPIFLGVINNPNPDGATRSKGSGKSDKLGLPRALDKPHVRTFEHPPK